MDNEETNMNTDNPEKNRYMALHNDMQNVNRDFSNLQKKKYETTDIDDKIQKTQTYLKDLKEKIQFLNLKPSKKSFENFTLKNHKKDLLETNKKLKLLQSAQDTFKKWIIFKDKLFSKNQDRVYVFLDDLYGLSYKKNVNELSNKIDSMIQNLKTKDIYDTNDINDINDIQKLLSYVNNVLKYDSKNKIAKTKATATINSTMDAIKSFFTYIRDKIMSLFDTFIYQLNKLYGDEFSYYEFFLIVFFIMLLLIVGIILYWDNVYRTAKKLSRCRQISKIADQNRNVDKHPFVYVIMIINESNLDGVLDKYVLKLEYNFVKKTTNAILGESEYVNEVEFMKDNVTDTSTRTNQFSYFDLAKMQSKKLENINKNLITDRKYKYVCMTPDNKILKTEIARELSTFVRDFGMNDKTSTYPIYNVLNAVQQKV